MGKTFTMSDGTNSSVPSDNTTMTSVLRELSDEGWTGQLISAPGGKVKCTTCNETSPAADLRVAAERRLEGASDPDDMSLVIAATCPSCDNPSTLVLGYGPAGSDEDGDIVVALRRSEESTSMPGGDPAVREAEAEADGDSESPGATIDDPTPVEPNEPG